MKRAPPHGTTTSGLSECSVAVISFCVEQGQNEGMTRRTETIRSWDEESGKPKTCASTRTPHPDPDLLIRFTRKSRLKLQPPHGDAVHTGAERKKTSSQQQRQDAH